MLSPLWFCDRYYPYTVSSGVCSGSIILIVWYPVITKKKRGKVFLRIKKISDRSYRVCDLMSSCKILPRIRSLGHIYIHNTSYSQVLKRKELLTDDFGKTHLLHWGTAAGARNQIFDIIQFSFIPWIPAGIRCLKILEQFLYDYLAIPFLKNISRYLSV